MTSQNNAPLALAIGGVAILGVMALHPTGAEAVADATTGTGHGLALARGVHGVAIAAIPLLLAGMTALSWRLRAQAELAVLALICFTLACISVLGAATMSGFVAPAALDRLPSVGDPLRDVAFQQLHYTGVLNQAFAKVYVGLAGAAFGLWAVAMSRDPGFPRALPWYGAVSGLLPFVGVAAGHLRLDVAGFGVVMVLHTSFMTWVALALRRPAIPPASAARS